jgi:predicted peptidase
VFVPNHYDPKKSWPIILFLHGIRKRGSDITLLDNYGLLKFAEETGDFNFIVLAPQCPAFVYWPTVRYEVLALLEQVIVDYNVDEKKVFFMEKKMIQYLFRIQLKW